jgi:hypothetical protein
LVTVGAGIGIGIAIAIRIKSPTAIATPIPIPAPNFAVFRFVFKAGTFSPRRLDPSRRQAPVARSATRVYVAIDPN